MKLKVSYQKVGGLDAKAFKAAVAVGNEAFADKWVDDFRDEHFEESATRRYGYQKRSGSGEPPRITRRSGSLANVTAPNPKYLWRKLRDKGHSRPNVYSGRSQTASKIVRIDSSPTRGAISFPGMPRYFWQYLKAGKTRSGATIKHQTPDKGAELTTLLDSELNIMHRAATDAVMLILAKAKAGPVANVR